MGESENIFTINIGGVFIYSKDAENLALWYKNNLGINWMHPEGSNSYFYFFEYKDKKTGKDASIAWSIIQSKKEVEIRGKAYRIGYRVENIDLIVKKLKEAGVEVEGIEENPESKYAYASDPDGNFIDLWEDKTLL